MPVGQVEVHGLRELQNAFRQVSTDLAKDLRTDLSKIGKPVADRAEQLATRDISNIGPVWSLMRVGVTLRTVYVAPRARRKQGSPRRNLGGLLMNRALQPALDESTEEIVHSLDDLLGRVTDRF